MKHKIVFFLVIIFVIISAINFLDGKLFLWWDNSRLFIYYPELYSNFILWWGINFSDFPLSWSYKPIYHLIFLTKILEWIKGIVGTYGLGIFVYSLINIGWFFGIYKLLSIYDLEKKDKYLRSLLSVLYITSSITFINFNSFFAGVFLVGTGPWVLYSAIQYLSKWKLKYLILLSIICLIFWVSFYAIPWVMPMILLILFFIVINKKKIPNKRIFLVTIIAFMSSLYWLIPFSIQFNIENSFFSKINIHDTFTPTVMNTSRDNSVMYPLWLQFHQSIAENYKWWYKEVFDKYYKYTLPFTLVLFFISIIWLTKYHKGRDHYYIYISFIFILFLYTVNIGPLREIFLLFNNIPGFSMFRNFYDKFGITYGIIYILFLFITLRHIPHRKLLYSYIIITITFISIPFILWEHLDNKVWKTEKSSLIEWYNNDYLEVLWWLKENSTTMGKNIHLPLSVSQYNIINWWNNSLYTWLEPSYIMSEVKNIVWYKFIKRLYGECNIEESILNISCFHQRSTNNDVNFFIVHKNPFPAAYIYNWVTHSLSTKIKESVERIYPIVLENDEYIVYGLKARKEDSNLRKVHSYKYIYQVKNLSDEKEINLNLFYTKYWIANFHKSTISIFSKNLFEHEQTWDWYNKWTLNKKNLLNIYWKNLQSEWYPKILSDWRKDYKYYIENLDGSIDTDIVLYFKPQQYFYIGCIISVSTFFVLVLSLMTSIINSRRKNDR